MTENKYIKVVDDNTVTRKMKSCPECGPGYFMGEHKDRFTCGHCGHTEFKK